LVAYASYTSMAIRSPERRSVKKHVAALTAKELELKEAWSSAGITGTALLQASLKRSSSQKSVADDSLVEEAGEVGPAWAPEESTVPKLSDNLLSAPALLAYMVRQASTKFANTKPVSIEKHPQASLVQVPTAFQDYVSRHWASLTFEILAFLCGVLILWFNELRSVKMDSLLSRGLSECESIDVRKKLEDETLGCLVHVQAQTVAIAPVEDPQFQSAVVHNCLKLQSSVEVYEWVQNMKISQAGSQSREAKNPIQYTFHKEWTTVHRNSLQFQRQAGKPSPDNPRPPRGLNLGTFTSICKNVQLGGFTLPDDMTEQFGKFKPAMQLLPPTLQACGLVFYANKDGYFYARPSQRSMWNSRGGPSMEPMVGDVRVRFLCVPQGNATAVAVHCEMGGVDTFVPYRAIPRGCCTNESLNKQRLIEEGARSMQEVKEDEQDLAPCITRNRMMASCFCFPCSTIQRATKEVVTQEIYYISEELDPIEKPFDYVVPRNHLRVWMFRALGWLVCYLMCLTVVSSLQAVIEATPALRIYGAWAAAVLAAIIATSSSALVISVAYLCYSPSQAMKWALAMAMVILLPFIVGRIDVGVN